MTTAVVTERPDPKHGNQEVKPAVIVPAMQPPKGHNDWIPQYGSQIWDVRHLNVTKNS